MQEERKKVREYAISLGLCGVCLKNKNIINTVYCLRCKKNLDKAKAKQRSNPLNCSRCGRKKESIDYKTCESCRKHKKIIKTYYINI